MSSGEVAAVVVATVVAVAVDVDVDERFFSNSP
jgi:hypothetical protein